MGESFKHLSQSLIGYVDEIEMDTVTGMPHVPDQTMIGLEATY